MSQPRLWLLGLLGSGCTRVAPPQTPQHKTVLIMTIDSLHRGVLLGEVEGWEVAPRLHELFGQSVLMPNTLSPRGLTQVALATLHTGTYPRDHQIRTNKSDHRPMTTTLAERFGEAGYQTLGFSANMCGLLETGFDSTGCTWADQEPGLGDLADRDRLLVDQVVESFAALDLDQAVFAWVHLNQPHDPYTLVEPYYSELHPEAYEGTLDPSLSDQVHAITLGRQEADEADLRHLLAAYASQVRATDDQIARVLDSLVEADRYEDALILFTADHGEELGAHGDYFFHGCSPYNPVLGVATALRAPDQLPEGIRHEDWIGTVDLAPTLLELAGLSWEGPGNSAGESRLNEMVTGDFEARPRFFERGMETVGVIEGTDKLILSGEAGYSECPPYADEGGSFPGEITELYDLQIDPAEQQNLAGQGLEQESALSALICSYMGEAPWTSAEHIDGAEADNALLERCGL